MLNISVISSGKNAQHTLMITNNNELFAFGCNRSSQFGNNVKSKHAVQMYPIRIKTESKMLDNYQICQIQCGSQHCIFLSECGHIFSCGSNTYGQVLFA